MKSSASIWCVLCVVAALLTSGCAMQDSIDKPVNSAITSGLQPGDDIVPWNPIHVSGPDAGTNACPVCTYGERPAIVIFAQNGPDAGQLAEKLDALVVQQKARQLKGFLIVLGTDPASLKQMASAINAPHIGICYPDPATLAQDLKSYKISPAAKNTVIIYKNYKVSSNFVDLPADRFDEVSEAVSKLQ